MKTILILSAAALAAAPLFVASAVAQHPHGRSTASQAHARPQTSSEPTGTLTTHGFSCVIGSDGTCKTYVSWDTANTVANMGACVFDADGALACGVEGAVRVTATIEPQVLTLWTLNPGNLITPYFLARISVSGTM